MTYDWLFAGLGNPGSGHSQSRHNAGFMVVDALAEKHRARIEKFELAACTAVLTLHGQTVLLAKPQTFMNESGQALAALQRYYKIPLEKLLVVYDDLDFELGQAKLRESGGSGTHNGMKSIMAALGSENFPRLRLGIGPRPAPVEGKDFVLSKFSKDQRAVFVEVIDKSVLALESVVQLGLPKAMNQVNR